MKWRREDADPISFDETRGQSRASIMAVFQVYGLLAIAAVSIATADVVVQPGYAPVGSAYREAYSEPTYPATTLYQYESQDQHGAPYADYSSSPGFRYAPAHYPSSPPAHVRARRSAKNETDAGVPPNVPPSTPLNDTETVVDSKNPKKRTIATDVNANKMEGTSGMGPTLLNLNPERMSRNVPDFKATSYEKPVEEPTSVRIIHPEPKMGNAEEQRDTRSWLTNAGPRNKPTDVHHVETAEEKARKFHGTISENAFRSMVEHIQEISGGKPQQHPAELRMNHESKLQDTVQKSDHVGSTQQAVPQKSPLQETARSHEQATQVDKSAPLIGKSWPNADMTSQVHPENTAQDYMTGLAQPSQMPAVQILRYTIPAYDPYRSVAPQWQTIMPSYYAPQVYGYEEPIVGYSPLQASYRNFPDPRPVTPTLDQTDKHAEHQQVTYYSKPYNTTAVHEDIVGSYQSSEYDESVPRHSSYTSLPSHTLGTSYSRVPTHTSGHRYTSVPGYTSVTSYGAPQTPTTYSTTYYSYPGSYGSYVNPYSAQPYVTYRNSQNPNPIVGTSLARPHHTKYYHKAPGIYDTRPGHTKYITPTYYSYSSLRKENPYPKSYLPSAEYMTQPQPQLMPYSVYI